MADGSPRTDDGTTRVDERRADVTTGPTGPKGADSEGDTVEVAEQLERMADRIGTAGADGALAAGTAMPDPASVLGEPSAIAVPSQGCRGGPEARPVDYAAISARQRQRE